MNRNENFFVRGYVEGYIAALKAVSTEKQYVHVELHEMFEQALAKLDQKDSNGMSLKIVLRDMPLDNDGTIERLEW